MVTRSSINPNEVGEHDDNSKGLCASQGYVASSEDSARRRDAIVMAAAMAGPTNESSYSGGNYSISNSKQKHGFVYNPPEQERSPPLQPKVASENSRDGSAPGEPAQRKEMPPSPMVTPPTHSIRNEKIKSIEVTTLNSSSKPAPSSHPNSGKPKGVPHVYHDYSQVPDMTGYVRKKTGGVTQPFPEKLHEMLTAVEQPEEEGAQAIVSWLPHGRAFIVRKPKLFTADIMPRYFKQTKLTSFQRQLNLYGFRRITQGPDAGAYYHEMFLKGRPGLSQRMARQKVKGTGHKQPADVKTEPNFYLMPPLTAPPPPPPPPVTADHAITVGSVTATPNVTNVTTPVQATSPREQQNQTLPPLPAAPERTGPTGQYTRREQHPLPSFEQPYYPAERRSTPPVNAYRSASAAAFAAAVQVEEQRTPDNWRQRYQTTSLPVSPGLHGAAHLLHGIASGRLKIPEADFLGSTADDNKDGQNQTDEASQGEDTERQEDSYSQEGQYFGSSLQPRFSAPNFGTGRDS